MQVAHTPVMVNECLDLLVPPQRAGDALVMCDSTLGEGGHTAAFLEHYPNLHIIGIDRDSEQIKRAKERLSPFGSRVTFCNAWFDDYYEDMNRRGHKADIILFDLGISMFHFRDSGRGFSFQRDEPLDMRLNPSAGQSVVRISTGSMTLTAGAGGYSPTAADIVNGLREDEIADIIYKYGGERFSRRIASAVVQARSKAKITSSAALADIVYGAVPSKYRHGAIHPATRTFQALRIAVNGELDRLERALPWAFDCLNDGGRMGVISFHSLEDRITKQFFRKMATTPCEEIAREQPSVIARPKAEATYAVLITRKGVKASESEVSSNPPSRSATLRVVEKRGVL